MGKLQLLTDQRCNFITHTVSITVEEDRDEIHKLCPAHTVLQYLPSSLPTTSPSPSSKPWTRASNLSVASMQIPHYYNQSISHAAPPKQQHQAQQPFSAHSWTRTKQSLRDQLDQLDGREYSTEVVYSGSNQDFRAPGMMTVTGGDIYHTILPAGVSSVSPAAEQDWIRTKDSLQDRWRPAYRQGILHQGDLRPFQPGL